MSDPNYIDVGSPATRPIEECAELVKAICKAQRFGWYRSHPDRPGYTNTHAVLAEMAEVTEAIARFQEHMRKTYYENSSPGDG